MATLTRTSERTPKFEIKWLILIGIIMAVVAAMQIFSAASTKTIDLNQNRPDLNQPPPSSWTWTSKDGHTISGGNVKRGCDWQMKDKDGKTKDSQSVSYCISWKLMFPLIRIIQSRQANAEASVYEEFINFLQGGNLPPPAIG